jgi:hypothetical protein
MTKQKKRRSRPLTKFGYLRADGATRVSAPDQTGPDRRIVSVPQWADRSGLADDGKSIAAARGLIAQGDGPTVTKINRLTRNGPVTVDGVRLREASRWLRKQPWAKYLAERAASERERLERRSTIRRTK